MKHIQNSNRKLQQYQALINSFKKQKFSDLNLQNPFDIKEVPYNYNVLNPWNLWHGNIEADILLIGQDWSDLEYFKKNFTNNWESERKSQTNINLKELFFNLGYDIGLPDPSAHPIYRYLPLFFTNAVLGIKKDKDDKPVMSKQVKEDWYKETGIYLIALINIIQPKIIIAMGEHAYDSLKELYTLPTFKNSEEAISHNGKYPLINGAKLFRVAHCSGLGLANRKMEIQEQDWKRINDLMNNNFSNL